jgi:hypothetical protein
MRRETGRAQLSAFPPLAFPASQEAALSFGCPLQKNVSDVRRTPRAWIARIPRDIERKTSRVVIGVCDLQLTLPAKAERLTPFIAACGEIQPMEVERLPQSDASVLGRCRGNLRAIGNSHRGSADRLLRSAVHNASANSRSGERGMWHGQHQTSREEKCRNHQ